MATLLLALAFASGTALGVWWYPTSHGGLLLAVAGAVAVVAGLVRGGGRIRAGAVVAVFGLCGVVRGGGGPAEAEVLAVEGGLVRAVVRGASTPAGPRCEVVVEVAEVAERWLLQVDPARCPLSEGQEVWIRAGDLSVAGGPRWPGDVVWDPRRRGVERSFSLEHVWAGSEAEGGYWAAVARLRQAGEAASRGAPERGFVIAGVLGLPAALAPDERERLRRAGLGHLVAVSGMNVAVAAMLLRGPLLRLGLLLGGGLWLGCALSWLPVAAYVGMTGAAAPAVRAAVMFTLVQLGALLGRPGHGLTLLAVACAGLLAWRPAWALDPGFQLSVAAMAVLVRPVRFGEAAPGLLRQSWEVTWVTCPIGLLHFGEAAVWGVATNLVAVPVFTLWVLPLGALGCGLWPWLGSEALTPAGWGARVILDVASAAARGPVVPAWGLAVTAGVCMAVRLVRPKWPLPGFWVGGATIAAVVVMRPAVAVTEPPGWFAVGGARQPAIVAPLAGTRLACVRDPGLHAEAWPPMLAALGYVGVAGVAVRRGEEPPHVAALRVELAASGMWRPTPGCAAPESKAVRGAIKECLERVGRKVAAVRTGPECFVGGRWVAMGRE